MSTRSTGGQQRAAVMSPAPGRPARQIRERPRQPAADKDQGSPPQPPRRAQTAVPGPSRHPKGPRAVLVLLAASSGTVTTGAQPCSGVARTGTPCGRRTRDQSGWCGQCAGVPNPTSGPHGPSLGGWSPGPDPLAPPDWFAQLNEAELAKAAANPALPVEMLRELVGTNSPVVRAGVAANPQLPSALIIGHATDPTADVRAGAASNPNCPTGTLAVLAGDPSKAARYGVAKNSSSPPDALRVLAADPAAGIRARAGRHTATPPEMLALLAGDRTPLDRGAVRDRAISNPNCPPVVLAIVASDPDTGTATAALKNPSCPPEVLAHAAASRDGRFREAALTNPSCPPEVLGAVAIGTDARAARLALANPSCPPADRAHGGLLAD